MNQSQRDTESEAKTPSVTNGSALAKSFRGGLRLAANDDHRADRLALVIEVRTGEHEVRTQRLVVSAMTRTDFESMLQPVLLIATADDEQHSQSPSFRSPAAKRRALAT